VARQPFAARVAGRVLRLGVAAQAERPPDPLYVDADDARSLGGTPDRRKREACEVLHPCLVTVGERLGDLRTQLLEIDLLLRVGARAGTTCLDDPGVDC